MQVVAAIGVGLTRFIGDNEGNAEMARLSDLSAKLVKGVP